MKKIVANINKFNLKQIIFVYQDGNKIDAFQTNNERISIVIKNFLKEYPESQIILQGAKNQINKIKKELSEKYNILVG